MYTDNNKNIIRELFKPILNKKNRLMHDITPKAIQWYYVQLLT